MESRCTMVNEPDGSIGSTFLNFFEKHLGIGPRDWQAGDGGYVFSKCAIRVLIRRESGGRGIAWVHGEELH